MRIRKTSKLFVTCSRRMLAATVGSSRCCSWPGRRFGGSGRPRCISGPAGVRRPWPRCKCWSWRRGERRILGVGWQGGVSRQRRVRRQWSRSGGWHRRIGRGRHRDRWGRDYDRRRWDGRLRRRRSRYGLRGAAEGQDDDAEGRSQSGNRITWHDLPPGTAGFAKEPVYNADAA